eukprot:TRINITY_DN3439_c0_g1_i1.p1 TRINITY_DN3439_c0_g1~~TRINITY_DN3439_c0_g1_i1.p1  ORF type:complete len:507 (-),score=48.58 TRINITY_DN3439_c0_g1_i1:82-1602(-)
MTENYICFSSKAGYNLIAVPYTCIQKFVHSIGSIHFSLKDGQQLKLEGVSSPKEMLRLIQPKQEQKTLHIINDFKRLKITILTVGSRGDVQPFIALGLALKDKGHAVRLATHKCYQTLVSDYQLDFFELPGDPRELIELCVRCGLWNITFIREGLQKFGSWVDECLLACWNACQGAEAIIAAPSSLGGVHIAEKLKIPFFSAFTMPYSRTSAFSHPFVGDAIQFKNAPHLNFYSFVLLEQVFYQPIRTHINSFRTNIGLKPIGVAQDGHCLYTKQVPFLYSFSTAIVSRPTDWGDFIHITGYWFLEDVHPEMIPISIRNQWQPPKDIVEFIEAESIPPIYVGFGSIVCSDPKNLTRIMLSALNQTGLRAIVAKCWGLELNGNRDSDRIHVISDCPHEWLFPRVRAVVHHGGAGTTAIGIACGKPTVIVSFFGDQFFWGKRIVELEVGMNIPYTSLTVENLAESIKHVLAEPSYQLCAKRLGSAIRETKGVEKAVELFHELLPQAII